jgi:glycosyltransferase involved in cell wall biosynthesis
LYGDEQLDLILRWRKLLRCPLVVTFHLPGQRVAKRFELYQAEEIKGIDAAIVLAKSEVPVFQQWFGSKVVYVPHGIDMARFKPIDSTTTRNRLKLLIVGHHMRDWESIHRVIDEVHHRKINVIFHAVIPRDHYPYFTGCANVTLHSDISEEQLIDLYCDADGLFLPVTNATANNAVLEALACGTPVITTDIGGMADYVDNGSGWLLQKGDVASMVGLIEQLSVNRELIWAKREKARAQASRFDWRRIAEQTISVYSAVRGARSPSATPGDL